MACTEGSRQLILCLVRPMSALHRRAIASLISKSQKAQQKLAAGTWQHKMLRNNLEALHVASALVCKETNDSDRFTEDQLSDALCALGSMIERAENAQAKFSPGTSHHTSQRNRVEALRSAEARTKSALIGRKRLNQATQRTAGRSGF